MDTVATSAALTTYQLMSHHGGDQTIGVTQVAAVPADLTILLLDIQEMHRKRQDLLRAELRLGNHIEAVYRRHTGLTQLERARWHKKASNGKGQCQRVIQRQPAQPDDDSAGVHYYDDSHVEDDARAPLLASNGKGQSYDVSLMVAALPDDDSAGATPVAPAPPTLASHGKGQNISVNPRDGALPDDDTANGGDHPGVDTHTSAVPADLATFLAKDAKAFAWCTELFHGRDYYADARKPYEKRLERLAHELPVWPWVEGVRGFGALGLAQIVAECGDLSRYANPGKLWKRMGLAVMPDGQRQRKVSDAEQALLHGYSPQRRSLIYVIADSLIKNNREGAYRTYYLAEKVRQREKLPDAPQAHIHNRALRHMSKRLLKHLWQVWNGREPSDVYVPIADDGDEALAAD